MVLFQFVMEDEDAENFCQMLHRSVVSHYIAKLDAETKNKIESLNRCIEYEKSIIDKVTKSSSRIGE